MYSRSMHYSFVWANRLWGGDWLSIKSLVCAHCGQPVPIIWQISPGLTLAQTWSLCQVAGLYALISFFSAWPREEAVSPLLLFEVCCGVQHLRSSYARRSSRGKLTEAVLERMCAGVWTQWHVGTLQDVVLCLLSRWFTTCASRLI